MSDIYDLHKKAFPYVSAFVIVGSDDKANPSRVATVAFKYPKDGAGRLYCYLHIFGGPMTRGFATGGGYDKRTAAASVAARKVQTGLHYAPDTHADACAIQNALLIDDGRDWERCVREAGFYVFSAV